MPDKPADAAATVEAQAMLVGLRLDPAYRPGVIVNLERIAEMAALVMEFPLPDEVEPAPVFRP